MPSLPPPVVIQKRVNRIVADILLANLNQEEQMSALLAVAGYEWVVTPKGQQLIVSIRKSRREKAERRPQRKGACWWRPKTRRKKS